MTATSTARRVVADLEAADGLRPQDLTVTLLGDHLRGSADTPVWVGGLVGLLGDFGFTVEASRVALSRLTRRGLLVRERRGRHSFCRLSAHARRVLDEGAQRIFGFGRSTPWDGTWTLVTYSIPERRRPDRERLRARLAFLGFGSRHDGHWIAPRDRTEELAALVADLGLEEQVHTFLGRPSPHERVDDLLAAWDLDGLDDRYRGFVDDFAGYEGSPLDDRDALVVRTLVMHHYRRFPGLDPDLPPELRPGPSARDEAVALFGRLWHGLEAPAGRHFDARVRTAARDQIRSSSARSSSGGDTR